MAGEVITTGTRAADAARADARQGTDPSAQDAEQAEAAVAADVPEPRVLNGTPGPTPCHSPARRARRALGTTRAQRARAAAAQSQPADAAAPGVGVRRRLARLGAQRGAGINPVLEPLIKTVRATHPKADVRLDRAGLRVGRLLAPGPEAAQRRPVHHPPARGGDDPGRARHEHRDDLRRAAARHGRGHPLHADRAARRVRRGRRRAGRRRHQAGQGQVRRVRRGRDRPQDGRRDVPRHPGPGDQARRPAAQHADAALPARGRSRSASPARPWRSTPRWPTGSA